SRLVGGAGDERGHRHRSRELERGDSQGAEQARNGVRALHDVPHEETERHCASHTARRERVGPVYEQTEYTVAQRVSDVGLYLLEEARSLFHGAIIGALHAAAVKVGVVPKTVRHPHQGEGNRKSQHDEEDEQPQHEDGNLWIRHRPCPSDPESPTCLVSPMRSATAPRSLSDKSTASSSSTSSTCCGHSPVLIATMQRQTWAMP